MPMKTVAQSDRARCNWASSAYTEKQNCEVGIKSGDYQRVVQLSQMICLKKVEQVPVKQMEQRFFDRGFCTL